MWKRRVGIGLLALMPFAVLAGDTSDETFVFVNPAYSSFWHTATNRTMTLPIYYPEGASSATLAVSGTTYRASYAVTTDAITLTLPVVEDRTREDVYELTLTFDDGTVQQTRLGLIEGLGTCGEGFTRCCMDMSAAKWQKAHSHGVLPIPYGMTALTVNGEPIEEGSDGFTGAQGWYALPGFAIGSIIPVSMTADGVDYDISLTIKRRDGFSFVVK